MTFSRWLWLFLFIQSLAAVSTSSLNWLSQQALVYSDRAASEKSFPNNTTYSGFERVNWLWEKKKSSDYSLLTQVEFYLFHGLAAEQAALLYEKDWQWSLRELTLKLPFESSDLGFGRQINRLGQLSLFSPLDHFSPSAADGKDFLRTGVDSLSLEYYPNWSSKLTALSSLSTSFKNSKHSLLWQNLSGSLQMVHGLSYLAQSNKAGDRLLAQASYRWDSAFMDLSYTLELSPQFQVGRSYLYTETAAGLSWSASEDLSLNFESLYRERESQQQGLISENYPSRLYVNSLLSYTWNELHSSVFFILGDLDQEEITARLFHSYSLRQSVNLSPFLVYAEATELTLVDSWQLGVDVEMVVK